MKKKKQLLNRCWIGLVRAHSVDSRFNKFVLDKNSFSHAIRRKSLIFASKLITSIEYSKQRGSFSTQKFIRWKKTERSAEEKENNVKTNIKQLKKKPATKQWNIISPFLLVTIGYMNAEYSFYRKKRTRTILLLFRIAMSKSIVIAQEFFLFKMIFSAFRI